MLHLMLSIFMVYIYSIKTNVWHKLNCTLDNAFGRTNGKNITYRKIEKPVNFEICEWFPIMIYI